MPRTLLAFDVHTRHPLKWRTNKESKPQTINLTATAVVPHSKARGISKPWGAPAPDNGP